MMALRRPCPFAPSGHGTPVVTHAT
jgi:hypothetical protein